MGGREKEKELDYYNNVMKCSCFLPNTKKKKKATGNFRKKTLSLVQESHFHT